MYFPKTRRQWLEAAAVLAAAALAFLLAVLAELTPDLFGP